MKAAFVVTDASFCHKTLAAGWAIWLQVSDEEIIKRSGLFKSQPRTSIEAERYAYFNGLSLAYSNGGRLIKAHSDCHGVIRASQTGDAKYRDAAKRYWPDAKVIHKNVRGHSKGNTPAEEINLWCDTEAKKLMRKQRDG